LNKEKAIARASILLPHIIREFGTSKHDDRIPLIRTKRDKCDVGEYNFLKCRITIHHNQVKSKKELIKTVLHEYKHYLQCPYRFQNHLNRGSDYWTHPMEVAARAFEKKYWKNFKNLI